MRQPSGTSIRYECGVIEGRTYLKGWCRRAEGVRTFRLDRILDVTVLDVPAEVPGGSGVG